MHIVTLVLAADKGVGGESLADLIASEVLVSQQQQRGTDCFDVGVRAACIGKLEAVRLGNEHTFVVSCRYSGE